MKEQMEPDSLSTFAAIAYRCLRKDRDERPTMIEVVKELEAAIDFQEKGDANAHSEGSGTCLFDPESVLSAFKQYRLSVIAEVSVRDILISTNTTISRLSVIAEVSVGDILISTNTTISSIEFDKDDELFATAGVSRCIKVFDFSKIVSEPLGEHHPAVEISTSSKLSCLSWNKDIKNHLAASDYEGIVTVWDVNSQEVVMEYKEHEKRAWSVDFSCMEPSMLVSGGDDCKIKVWCTKQEESSINIDMRAPICCVKYHPSSDMHIAVACADHCSYYYDLRNTSHPLHIFAGHRKDVSYVKFLSSDELVTTSVDSTLRLWDLKRKLPVRTFKGHSNVRNFVGLSVTNDFMACGSETNEVFAYHKRISKPLTWQVLDTTSVDEDVFISTVCWKSSDTPTPTLIAANSLGTVRVLVLET